jgi:hypothetical protein
MGETYVEVTQDMIDAAVRKNSSRCVVAAAIATRFPNASRITVDVHSIKFTNGPRRYTYLTPPKVMDYIVAFDAGDNLHPFRFRLRDDQRLVQQRQVNTAEGQRRDTTTRKARDRRAKLEKVEADPTATPAEKEVAADRYAEALAEAAAVREETAGSPTTRNEDVSDLPPMDVRPPSSGKRSTVFYRNRREYGQRHMRVNQPGDQPGDFRGPLDSDPGHQS